MDIEKNILDIFAMTITVDGKIDKAELLAVNEILDKMKYNFSIKSKQYFADLCYFSAEKIESNFKRAVNELNSLDVNEKKYILKFMMKLIDADNVMHEDEVTLIGALMREWNVG